MELDTILGRLTESLLHVDAHTMTQNSSRPSAKRGIVPYLLGAGTLTEDQFCREALEHWMATHPHEHSGLTATQSLEVSYPGSASGDTCDFVLRTRDFAATPEIPFEWAIEVKLVRFVGDNGKLNEYAVNKTVSPFRTARSSVLDARRLPEFTRASRRAVIWYGFELDNNSPVVAGASEVAAVGAVRESGVTYLNRGKEVAKVLKAEQPPGGTWTIEPMFGLFESAASSHGVKLGPRFVKTFGGLTRHPIFRMGRFVAWEVM